MNFLSKLVIHLGIVPPCRQEKLGVELLHHQKLHQEQVPQRASTFGQHEDWRVGALIPSRLFHRFI